MTEGILGASGLTSAAKRLYSAWAALCFWAAAALRLATMYPRWMEIAGYAVLAIVGTLLLVVQILIFLPLH
jgi:hypothetical protein